MKKFIFLLICIMSSVLTEAQNTGINKDPNQKQIGSMPYEMYGRKEERVPIADFDDCTKWKLTSNNCDVKLYRTKEQRVFREYSGKVVYKALKKKAHFNVELIKPILLDNPWDAINFWNYGDHWLWGEPNWKTAMNIFALVEDADGKVHELKMAQSGYDKMNAKYWFLNHHKIIEKIEGPTKFNGFKFYANSADVGTEHTLFLESVYIYKEELKPLTFKPLPNKMPFPLREQTILPINKVSKFKNKTTKSGKNYIFTYSAEDAKIKYTINPDNVLGEISVQLNTKNKVNIANGAKIVIDTEENYKWQLLDKKISKDTLKLSYLLKGENLNQKFNVWYTINQKTLIYGIDERGETGVVSEIKLGTTDSADDSKLTLIPFLNFNNMDRPAIFYSDDLFFFKMFDWYYSNASSFYGGRKKNRNGQASYNGGVKYIAKTDGKRNLLREKLFINVSPDVQEVFPTIDNPKSPMKDAQADRVWVVNGGTDLDKLGNFVTDLRSKGVEKVSIRYHEGFWREGGESYTFKLKPNPKLGVKKIKDYVAWVQSQGWRVGLYSNYTDFAPVNSNWNEDWVKRGPNGEWEVSWSRCYSPKPQIAWEQQAIFAPQIQKMFNTNHSYCDVHTAVSPMTRVDYDPRVPGAGTFRHVINCYGLLLMNESKTYQGPVYSEGGNHWWYAGLLDGNYANDKLERIDVFPDFHLMQIHPKEMDAGHTGKDNEYFAYTLAYGNIGLLSDGLDAVKKYSFIQPLQKMYSMIPVSKIEYSDGEKYYYSSDAIKKGLVGKSKLHVVYQSGFNIYTNFSDELWTVEANGKKYELPKFGVLAYDPNSNLMSFSGNNKESKSVNRIDRTISDKLCFLDTFGNTVTNGNLRGKGCYVLKKEKFGWEIIAIGELSNVDFDKKLIGFKNQKVKIQPVDKNGNNVDYEVLYSDEEVIKFKHNPEVYKYKIVPIR